MNPETLPHTELPTDGEGQEPRLPALTELEIATSLNESQGMLRLVEPVVSQMVHRALKARLERQAKGFAELVRLQAEGRARAERYSGILDSRYFDQQFFRTP